MTLADLQQV